MYFVGKYIYSIDSKDRVSFPAKFRRMLPSEVEEILVVTKGAERCIHLYPRNMWYEFVHRYWSVLYSNKVDYRRFALWCLKDTYEMQLDRQGRIQIPKELITFAQLKKEVAIIGYNTRLEVWDPERLEDFIGKDEEAFLNMAVNFTSVNPAAPSQPTPAPSPAPYGAYSTNPPPAQPYPQGGYPGYPPYPMVYYPPHPYYAAGYYPPPGQAPQAPPDSSIGNSSAPSAKPPSYPNFPPAPTDEDKSKG